MVPELFISGITLKFYAFSSQNQIFQLQKHFNQILHAFSHSLAIDDDYFMKIYRKFTNEPYFAFDNEITLPSDHQLHIKKNLSEDISLMTSLRRNLFYYKYDGSQKLMKE